VATLLLMILPHQLMDFTILASLSKSITLQAIELENCSNSQKMRRVFQLGTEKIWKVWVLFFVDDVISRVVGYI